jgi:hypothetical protein
MKVYLCSQSFNVKSVKNVMTDFLEEFMRSYGPEVSKQLSSNLGVRQDVAAQMIPVIAPLVLGGLKRQMVQQGGAPRVDHILDKYGSSSVLNNIGGTLSSQARIANPDPRLGGLLGESGVQAANLMSKKFGIDNGTAMKAIVMLAPIILGFLTSRRDGTGSSGLASLLNQGANDSILDDVAGLFLGGLTGGGSTGVGGILGSLLGGLTGSNCRSCGRKRESDFKYCPECGNKV